MDTYVNKQRNFLTQKNQMSTTVNDATSSTLKHPPAPRWNQRTSRSQSFICGGISLSWNGWVRSQQNANPWLLPLQFHARRSQGVGLISTTFQLELLQIELDDNLLQAFPERPWQETVYPPRQRWVGRVVRSQRLGCVSIPWLYIWNSSAVIPRWDLASRPR